MDIVPVGGGVLDAVDIAGAVPVLVGEPLGQAALHLGRAAIKRGARWIAENPREAIGYVRRGYEYLRPAAPVGDPAREGFVNAQFVSESVRNQFLRSNYRQMSGRAFKRARVIPGPGLRLVPARSTYNNVRSRSLARRRKYQSGPRRGKKVTKRGPMKFSPTTYCPPFRQGGNIFTKLKSATTVISALTGTGGVSTIYTFIANDIYDPLGPLGAVRPKGAVEYEAMFNKYRVHMTKYKFSMAPAGTTSADLLGVFQCRRGNAAGGGVAPEGTTWTTNVHSVRRQGPIMNFGNTYHKGEYGAHGVKRIFMPHNVLGMSKKEYNSDTAYEITAAGAPPDGYRACVDLYLIASDLTTGLSVCITCEITQYVEFCVMKTAL